MRSFLLAAAVAVFFLTACSGGDSPVSTPESTQQAVVLLTPTPEPTHTPTVEPTAEPTPEPTPEPEPEPEIEVSPPPPPPPGPTTVVVRAAGLAFLNRSVSVRSGAPVTFVLLNEENIIPHDVQVLGMRSGQCNGPCSVSLRFTAPAPGRYAFSCSLHPDMTGTLSVTP
jgi:plastocyanin